MVETSRSFSPLGEKVPAIFIIGREGADAALSDGCHILLMVLSSLCVCQSQIAALRL